MKRWCIHFVSFRIPRRLIRSTSHLTTLSSMHHFSQPPNDRGIPILQRPPPQPSFQVPCTTRKGGQQLVSDTGAGIP